MGTAVTSHHRQCSRPSFNGKCKL